LEASNISKRAKSHLEEVGKGRYQIIITELNYQTNKAALVERIADLMKNKKIKIKSTNQWLKKKAIANKIKKSSI